MLEMLYDDRLQSLSIPRPEYTLLSWPRSNLAPSGARGSSQHLPQGRHVRATIDPCESGSLHQSKNRELFLCSQAAQGTPTPLAQTRPKQLFLLLHIMVIIGKFRGLFESEKRHRFLRGVGT